ncbi:MAG: NAD(P)H-quinone oxidoreductase [Rhodospirillaceae bacterium]|jgi:putative PIG3 family NAD(P)H quinone oxidoreductase|nr:NAD(P)H-quinone oxidoreductase [Rhodospirillaceae bacterium]MBT5458563.1 NAD(P)H-quinone oxidoreductase [Rhodospirillaceae bacterium]
MSDTLPDQVTVIEIGEPGGPEALKVAKRPMPQPGADEILIKSAAAGINRPDVMQREGNYPPPPGASDIPGLEVAGTVAALGGNVTGWSVGDPVCALVAGGGYADYCVAPAPQCLPIPAGLTMIEAAAVPETFFTVWDNLFTRGGLSADETVLIHGGSSGIGTTAIQLACAIGAQVIVTAGSTEKCRACEELGAMRAINYREEDFVAVTKEVTGGKGVNVVLDMVGGDYVARNLNVLAKGGRLVQIAIQKGTKAEIPVHLIMVKQIVFTGSTLRPRSVAEKAVIAADLKEKVWPLIEAGKVKPLIHETFPLTDISKAHALMDSGAHIGKIVVTI